MVQRGGERRGHSQSPEPGYLLLCLLRGYSQPICGPVLGCLSSGHHSQRQVCYKCKTIIVFEVTWISLHLFIKLKIDQTLDFFKIEISSYGGVANILTYSCSLKINLWTEENIFIFSMQEIDRPPSWEQEKLRAAEMTSICNSCCNDLANITNTETTGTAETSIQVRPKEVFILVLFFLLLLYSVISFLSQWNKNYREINHLPYYEIYIEKNSELQGIYGDWGYGIKSNMRALAGFLSFNNLFP